MAAKNKRKKSFGIYNYATQARELAGILSAHNYPTDAAERLAKEGMGSFELEHRITSTKPGEVGSLEYTHNIKRNHPSPFIQAPVRRACVNVVGRLWMGGLGAYSYELTDYDLRNIGVDFTRETVADWLGSHSGDFQNIVDFQAFCGSIELAWRSEDNECTYNDCMFPPEDDE